MKLPTLSRPITTILIVAMAGLTTLNLMWYAGLFQSPPNPPQEQLFLPGLSQRTVQIAAQPPVTDATRPLRRLLPVIIILASIAGLGLVGAAIILTRQRRQKNRDRVRIHHLQMLAQAFETYFERHGHYPVSATYDTQYYSAINIITEWNSYNFPPEQEMKQLTDNWPPSDPSFDPDSSEQEGNYLYYPHHFGQRFSLYAVLEAPSRHPIPDYTVIDKLPNTAISYNYRFNGPDHHVETSGQPTAPQPPAAAPPPQSPS